MTMTMWKTRYGNDDQTPRERELQYEVDRLREQQEHEREKAERAAKERRQERYAEVESNNRTASTWPEALIKQRALFIREAREETRDDDPDKYFAIGVQAVDKALEIWRIVNVERQEEISEIEQRLVRIENEIRMEVAQRLEQAGNHAQYHDIAFGIRENNIEAFLDW